MSEVGAIGLELIQSVRELEAIWKDTLLPEQEDTVKNLIESVDDAGTIV